MEDHHGAETGVFLLLGHGRTYVEKRYISDTNEYYTPGRRERFHPTLLDQVQAVRYVTGVENGRLPVVRPVDAELSLAIPLPQNTESEGRHRSVR
jgi:hypothetical protein